MNELKVVLAILRARTENLRLRLKLAEFGRHRLEAEQGALRELEQLTTELEGMVSLGISDGE